MRKSQAKRVRETRIQRAVTGLQIPMTRIVALYAHAEKLIDDGADDAALVQGIRDHLGAV
jgi:hypothetical protein